MQGPPGKDLGDYRKRGRWTLTVRLWHSLSPDSICKKSPDLLAALLPPPDLSLKERQRVVQLWAGMGGSLGQSGLRKNAQNPVKPALLRIQFSDKGPSIKWVCFPKFYGPLAMWPWLRISLHSSLNVICCLIITAWQWLMIFTCIPLQIELSKSPLRDRLKALPL